MKKFVLVCVACCAGLAQGCYSAGGLRHLAYRVSLVEDGRTTVDELRSILGEPDEVREAGDGGRVMVFSDLSRSTGRRIPLLGRYLGHETIATVRCVARNGVVVHCEYGEEIRE